jgi:hypothetical protein
MKGFLLREGLFFEFVSPPNSIVEKFSLEIAAYKSHKEFVEMKFAQKKRVPPKSPKDNSLIHEQLAR